MRYQSPFSLRSAFRLSLLILVGHALSADAITLIEFAGETRWRYTTGAPPNENWQQVDFDESTWSSARSPIGIGAPRLLSRIGNKDDAGKTPIYFRKTFRVKQASSTHKLVVWVRFDDGIVVRINGKEVARANMPTGALQHATHATKEMDGEDELRYHRFVVDATCLQEGDNVITVQVHPAPPSEAIPIDGLNDKADGVENSVENDMAFDLRLTMYEANELPPPVRFARLGPTARETTAAYHRKHYVGPQMTIPDGYVDGGRGMKLDEDGDAWSYREVISVDRDRDPLLKKHLEYARSEELQKLNAIDRATRIARYVFQLMTPKDKADPVRNTIKLQMLYEGREVLLGNVAQVCDSGVCRHRSLLYKILADEAKLNVALVRGNYRSLFQQGGHAWNELHLENGDILIVDTMNPLPDFHFPNVKDRAVRNYYTVTNKRMYPAAGSKQ